MKWFEVISGCDGYYSPSRFKTEKEAQEYVDRCYEDCDDIHVSEGPYEVSTDSEFFWS